MMKTVNDIDNKIGDLLQQGAELSQYLEWLNRFPTTISKLEAEEVLDDMDMIDKEIDRLETLKTTL